MNTTDGDLPEVKEDGHGASNTVPRQVNSKAASGETQIFSDVHQEQ